MGKKFREATGLRSKKDSKKRCSEIQDYEVAHLSKSYGQIPEAGDRM